MKWIYVPAGFTNTNSVLADGVDERLETTTLSSFFTSPAQYGAVSMWVKFLNSSDAEYAFDVWDDTAGTSESFFHLFKNPGDALEARIFNSSGTQVYNVRFYAGSGSSDPVPTNTWIHLVFGYRSTGSFGYEDGVQKASDNLGDSWIDTITDTLNTFYIFDSPRVSGFEANVYIDEFALYEGELTDTDVTNIYNSGSPPNLATISYSSGVTLEHWYRMGDDPSDSTATSGQIIDVKGSMNLDAINMEAGDITTDVP